MEETNRVEWKREETWKRVEPWKRVWKRTEERCAEEKRVERCDCEASRDGCRSQTLVKARQHQKARRGAERDGSKRKRRIEER